MVSLMLNQNLNILLKEGLIKQIKASDSRKKIMKLTNKGFETLDKAIPLWLEAEHQILGESQRYGFSVI